MEESRRRFEGTWNDLRRSLAAEFGGEPRWRKEWLLPVVGLVAGLAFAYQIRQRALPGGRGKISRAGTTPGTVED